MKDPRYFPISCFDCFIMYIFGLLACLLIFWLFCNCRYALVRNVGSESVQHSLQEGYGHHVRKSDVLTFEEEQIVLASKCCSVDHPHGLNNRMVIFCLRNFFIRGQSKLRVTSPKQFEIWQNVKGDEFLW
jgi:hypothetical protein